jgi:hypothetical protein
LIDFYHALVVLCIANSPSNMSKPRLKQCVETAYTCVQGHAHGGRNCTNVIISFWDNKKLLKDLKKN